MILLVLLGLLINNIIKQLYYLVSFVEFNEGVESVSPPKSASLKREREEKKLEREAQDLEAACSFIRLGKHDGQQLHLHLFYYVSDAQFLNFIFFTCLFLLTFFSLFFTEIRFLQGKLRDPVFKFPGMIRNFNIFLLGLFVAFESFHF